MRMIHRNRKFQLSGRCRRLITFALVAHAIPASSRAEDWPAPQAAVWKGEIAIGAELDPHGLPKSKTGTSEKPVPLRLGFSASWSISVTWQVIPESQETTPAPGISLDQRERKMLGLINTERQQQQLPALIADPALMTLARTHSATMGKLDELGHDLDGKTFFQRMKDANYTAERTAENVAQGSEDAGKTFALWMESEPHRENLLDEKLTRIGIGYGSSESGKHYWTLIFAKP